MESVNKQKHLTLDERRIIQTAIENGSTKAAIATILGKDKSTIGKEIKLHRELTHQISYPQECANIKTCKPGNSCYKNCPNFKPFTCTRRDRSPGACNKCPEWNHCRYNKYIYRAEQAQNEYKEELVDSRLGVNLTTEEVKEIAETIAPLLQQGQSPYQIINNHPELGICEKTLYNYLEGNVFSVAHISNMDLRRQVSRKIPKAKKTTLKKREDKKYLKGRTYKDYLQYLSAHPNAEITEMDTVYNDTTNGPYIQTFKWPKTQFLFALYHEQFNALTMKQGVDVLEGILGKETFCKMAEILKTDRGGEFVLAEEMERDTAGLLRTRVYYCDPMQSGQKGSLENKHEMLRYICPKGTDLTALGLTSQDKLNRALSHINSTPLESLNGKSPFEYLQFMYPELHKAMIDFGLKEIEQDKIILKPYLLK